MLNIFKYIIYLDIIILYRIDVYKYNYTFFKWRPERIVTICPEEKLTEATLKSDRRPSKLTTKQSPAIRNASPIDDSDSLSLSDEDDDRYSSPSPPPPQTEDGPSPRSSSSEESDSDSVISSSWKIMTKKTKSNVKGTCHFFVTLSEGSVHGIDH